MSELIKMPRALAEKMLAAKIFEQKYFDELEAAGMLTTKGGGARDYSKIEPLAEFNKLFNAFMETAEVKALTDQLARFKSVARRAAKDSNGGVIPIPKLDKDGNEIKKNGKVVMVNKQESFIREKGIVPSLYYQGLQSVVPREDGEGYVILERGEPGEHSANIAEAA